MPKSYYLFEKENGKLEVPEVMKKTQLERGDHGIRYLTEEGEIYYEFDPSYKGDKNYDMCDSLTWIHSHNLLLPRSLVYLGEPTRDNFVGYTMISPFEASHALRRDIPMQRFIESCDEFEHELKDISEEHQFVVDRLTPFNVVYTRSNEFKVFDTELFSLSSEEPYEKYKASMYEWANYVYDLLGNMPFPIDNEKLNELYKNSIFYGRCKPSYILSEMKKMIEERQEQEVDTVGSFIDGMHLIRRK